MIPADLVKTHLGSILFISTVDVASKKSLAQALVHAAPTGSGCHLRNVKIIRWIGLNEKLMEFKGEKELIYARHPKKFLHLGINRGHQTEKVSNVKLVSVESRVLA